MAIAPVAPTERMLLRFIDKVQFTDGCWLWVGNLCKGYGHFRPGGMAPVKQAHRIAYEVFVGPIPEGLTVDHLCRTPACVRPDHLEPVTMRENLMRGRSFSAINAAKTHCKRGHPFTEANTLRSHGRRCRTCKRAYEKTKGYWRRKAVAA